MDLLRTCLQSITSCWPTDIHIRAGLIQALVLNSKCESVNCILSLEAAGGATAARNDFEGHTPTTKTERRKRKKKKKRGKRSLMDRLNNAACFCFFSPCMCVQSVESFVERYFFLSLPLLNSFSFIATSLGSGNKMFEEGMYTHTYVHLQIRLVMFMQSPCVTYIGIAFVCEKYWERLREHVPFLRAKEKGRPQAVKCFDTC